MSNGKKIFKFLKEHGTASLDEILEKTGMLRVDATPDIEEYVRKGYIERLPDGDYRIKFVLNPPLPDEPIETKYWDYTKIREKLQGGGAVTPTVPADVPRKWRNPYLQYLPTQIDQGGRGTCVGFSTAIGLTLLYFAITKDLPTPEDLKSIQRNIEEQLGCANSKPLIRDNFGKRWKSPQFIYDRSREVGGVTEPSGSWLSAAVKAIRDYGACFETDCWTSKSAYCTTQFYPLKPGETTNESKPRILALGAEHKTKGYATVIDFDQFCTAIYTQWRDLKGGGFGLVPVNIYANYTQDGCVGNYPDPAGECVGSHAQCVVGYDLDAGTMEVRQSWGKDWSDAGGWSKRYWNEAAGAGFIILDDEEAAIGMALYSRVTISANVPCTYTINGEVHTDDPDVAALERGRTYEIVAFPKNPELVTAPSLEIDITPTEAEQSVKFVFTLKTSKKTLTEMIMEFFRMILNWIRRK